MNEFEVIIEKAYQSNADEDINRVCEYLTKDAPLDIEWYFKDGFFRVDVVREEYDSYIEYIENITDCRYCYLMNPTGITLMMSLSTFHRIL